MRAGGGGGSTGVVCRTLRAAAADAIAQRCRIARADGLVRLRSRPRAQGNAPAGAGHERLHGTPADPDHWAAPFHRRCFASVAYATHCLEDASRIGAARVRPDTE